ncbi:MAG: hypothetical protein WCK54_18635 [Desulfuromonadales bacterium]
MKDESFGKNPDPREIDFGIVSDLWRRPKTHSERHVLHKGSDTYRISDESFRDNEDPRDIESENNSTIRRRAENPREQQADMFKVKFYEWANFISTVFLYALVSASVSLATIAGYDRWYAQKVVAVDIKGYIAEQRDNYLAGKLNDDELKRRFDRLEAVITALPKNRVVIMGDAVVRNAETIKP